MFSFPIDHPISIQTELYINAFKRWERSALLRSVKVEVIIDDNDENCPNTLKEINRLGRVTLENMFIELYLEKEEFNHEINKKNLSYESIELILNRLRYLTNHIWRAVKETAVTRREDLDSMFIDFRLLQCAQGRNLRCQITRIQTLFADSTLTQEGIHEQILRNQLDWTKQHISYLEHCITRVQTPDPIKEEKLQKMQRSRDELERILEENFPKLEKLPDPIKVVRVERSTRGPYRGRVRKR